MGVDNEEMEGNDKEMMEMIGNCKMDAMM